MGYAYYELPDGREAGYGVRAECDALECINEIDRGLGFLCGEHPDGHRDADEAGCGKYFCETHLDDHVNGDWGHDCPSPECGFTDDDDWCRLIEGHDGDHEVEG